MTEIDLYGDIKRLEFKPSSFPNFCEEIQNLYFIDNPDNFIYEYETKDNKYYPLNIYNYEQFYMNDDVKKILIHTDENEAKYFIPEKEEKKEGKEDIIKDEENEKNEKNEPNFHDENINNEEKLFCIKEKMNPDIVKQKIINEYKEKIRNKNNIIDDKNKEGIIYNNNVEENKIEIINEKEINEGDINDNKNIDNQLNNIINENLDKLKNDLINESKIKLSHIVMESQLKNEEDDDGIETPLSVEKHTGIACNGCGVCPIEGVRYKCVFCSEFDYCEKCEKEKGYVHNHPLYKLRFKI